MRDYNKLESFIAEERHHMLRYLRDVVASCQGDLREHPDWYTEDGVDTPAIDVRLCVDLSDRIPSWIIRTGSADYDQYHSEYCAASCITVDTDAERLLAELISQLE